MQNFLGGKDFRAYINRVITQSGAIAGVLFVQPKCMTTRWYVYLYLSYEWNNAMHNRLYIFCNDYKKCKIDKPIVVYRFSGNVMKLRFKRHAYGKILTFFTPKYDFKINLMSYDKLYLTFVLLYITVLIKLVAKKN